MSLKALPNIFKMLKIDMVEDATCSQCIIEAFELLNNINLTLDSKSSNSIGDVYKFKNNIGTMKFQVRTLNDVYIFIQKLGNSENLKKTTMLDLSKKIKWIAPFNIEVSHLRTNKYPNLKCYTVTNKASFSLIKLALMKAGIKFEETPEYIIGKGCVFIAFKNEANEIKLIFDAN